MPATSSTNRKGEHGKLRKLVGFFRLGWYRIAGARYFTLFPVLHIPRIAGGRLVDDAPSPYWLLDQLLGGVSCILHG